MRLPWFRSPIPDVNHDRTAEDQGFTVNGISEETHIALHRFLHSETPYERRKRERRELRNEVAREVRRAVEGDTP